MTFYTDYNLNIPNLNGTFNYTGINFGNNFNLSNVQGFGGFGNFGGSFLNPGFDTFSTGTTVTSTPKETYKEYKERKAREYEERLEQVRKDLLAEQEEKEKKDMEAPLTEKEKGCLQKEALKLDTAENKKAESSLCTSMLFTLPFAAPALKSAFKQTPSTLDMFYKYGGKHMGLFETNPELMMNAQESMQKLEAKFAKDIRAAKGNQDLINKITKERDGFRTVMQNALDSNNPEVISKVTARFQTASRVKNGWFKRTVRGFRNEAKFESRLDTVRDASKNGQFKSVTTPKENTSFVKNMFGNKASALIAGSTLVLPFVFDWGNIKQARAVDKANKENGQETHYGRKQITQTSLKAVGGFVAYNVVDTAVRTAFKRGLGKLAGKLAARLAVKGGCKVLGAAVGSALPGLGNVLGLVAGAVCDWALNKYVFGKMKFFNNSGAKEAQIRNSNDTDLLASLSEQYMKGADLNKDAVSILFKKYGKDNFNELKKVHDMPEDKRNEYLAQLQAQQEALLQQQTAEQQQLVA